MGRHRIYTPFDVPNGVLCIVRGIVMDAKRRNDEIKIGIDNKDKESLYISMQNAIDESLEEIDVGFRQYLLDDIASGNGFDKSCASLFSSRGTYYRVKRKLIHDIAERLNLI